MVALFYKSVGPFCFLFIFIVLFFAHVFNYSTEASATLHPGCIIKRQIVNPCHRSEIINKYAKCDQVEEPKIDYLAFQELSKIDDRLTVFVCFFCVL